MQNFNWFPGHMKKNLEKIQAIAHSVNFFIQVIDARTPISGINDYLNQNIGSNKIVYLLSKVDLVDLKDLKKVMNANKQINFIYFENKDKLSWTNLQNQIKKTKVKFDFVNKIAIIGSPNVGKSTLIKKLTGKNVKVENKPGSTRGITYFKLDEFNLLLDSPGILLPAFANADDSYKAILCNNMPPQSYDEIEVLEWAKNYLNKHYSTSNALKFFKSEDIHQDIDTLAKTKSWLLHGNALDLKRTTTYLIQELQSGKYKITWDLDAI